MQIRITGLSSLSGLGNSLAEHEKKINAGESALRPLSEFPGLSPDIQAATESIRGAWIEPRSIALSRKWAPASTLALHVAKEAVADAGLEGEALTKAAIIGGSTRGNAWLSEWPGRRPFKLMAASNSMHGEIASAISIELGVKGPWQVISSGCAASLDALGTAWMMQKSGMAKHAIGVGVELPIVDSIVQGYLDTGVLSQSELNDPYSENTSGFHPGEGASAIVLEAFDSEPTEQTLSGPALLGFWCNSDAYSPIGMPDDGQGLRECIEQALQDLRKQTGLRHPVSAVCPHASGTWLHAKAEQQALLDALQPEDSLPLHVFKPYTGHTVGASGLLDSAILAHYLRAYTLPPNMPNLSSPSSPFTLPAQLNAFPEGNILLKIAVGMGGHNSIVALRA